LAAAGRGARVPKFWALPIPPDLLAPQPTASEERPLLRDLQSVLDAIFDAVIVLDERGQVESLNAEACRLLRASQESTRGEPVEALLGSEHAVARLARSVLASGRPAVEDEVPLPQREGRSLDVDIAASPLDAGRTVGVVIVLRDRTISRSLRERVDERERLDSYAQIAAGIAHEVKNPLGGIRGAAELLGSWAKEERGRETAALIVREVDRIAALVDDLMVFARDVELRLEPVNIHYLLDSVLDLLALDPLGDGSPVERFYDPSIPDLLADAARLKQVFLNLGKNALQAMEKEGGTVTVTTRMSLDERLVGEGRRGVPTVMVAISDTGPGIPRERLQRLATPFFTTRPGGTGLGLAVARHWVTRHGGALRITSQVGEGTTVRVALPLRLPKTETGDR
jgi:two-component system nitrogen regulation sensor histidine kinase GlnL